MVLGWLGSTFMKYGISFLMEFRAFSVYRFYTCSHLAYSESFNSSVKYEDKNCSFVE